MGQHIATVAALAILCAVMLVIGLSFAVIAYRLLSEPIPAEGGGGRRLGGSRQVWGAFFALVGVSVVGLSIWLGWSLTNYVPSEPPDGRAQMFEVDVEEVAGAENLTRKWIVEINFRKARAKAAQPSAPNSTSASSPTTWEPPAAAFSSRPLVPVHRTTHRY